MILWPRLQLSSVTGNGSISIRPSPLTSPGFLVLVVAVERGVYNCHGHDGDGRNCPGVLGTAITLHGNLLVDGVIASSWPLLKVFRPLYYSTRLKPYIYPVLFTIANHATSYTASLSDKALQEMDQYFMDIGVFDAHNVFYQCLTYLRSVTPYLLGWGQQGLLRTLPFPTFTWRTSGNA